MSRRRRCVILFPRADDTESQNDLKSSTDLWLARHLDNMRIQLRKASNKWGYDFEADRPNPVANCEFVWTAVPANQVPLPYRTRGPTAKEPKARTDQSALGTSSTPTVSNVAYPGRKRPRQTSLNGEQSLTCQCYPFDGRRRRGGYAYIRVAKTFLSEFFAVSKQSPNEPSGGAYTSYTSVGSKVVTRLVVVRPNDSCSSTVDKRRP
ncbi:CDI domain containing protein [Trichuris trichiura]|uniref:CDI domain containing protein n=1 Tax=Trichuris trichiura TaxID=36087 RepID=A0A077Z5A7_TRITR|nr:CDI domain containing protein [Trichuris trichiura]